MMVELGFKSKLMMIVLSLMLVVSCSQTENKSVSDDIATTKEVLPENLLVVDYAVEGMVCAMGCAKTIQDELSKMNGMASCNVSFEEGKAHAEFDKTILSEKEIIAKIESVADGQYKAIEWKEKEQIIDQLESNEEERNSENEKSTMSINLPSFETPNLFMFLLKQL